MKSLKYALRILLPIIVLALCFFIAKKIIDGKKKVKLHAAPPVISVVEAEAAIKGNYRVVLESQGTVRARTESAIVPEVSGKVVEVSRNFREGGYFKEGELLLRLDQRNYETDVALQVAELAKARQALAEEEARALQAMRNWKRLRAAEEPSPLAVREPQLLSAMAEARAAEARLHRAELDLERTRIRAPYAGRVLEKSVDIGEYVAGGSTVARVYAVDYAEIRLPLSEKELEFVDIPEFYRGQAQSEMPPGPEVDIIAEHGSKRFTWKAVIVRSEGAIDEKSRQLFVVADVADPYGKKGSGAATTPALKVGEFVEARIKGHLLTDVYVVPRLALREGHELFIAKDSKLVRRKVNVVWKDRDNIVIDSGLEEGELVVTTPAIYMKGGKFKIETPLRKGKGPAVPAVPMKPAIEQPAAPEVGRPATGKPLTRKEAVVGNYAVTEKPSQDNKLLAGNDSERWDISIPEGSVSEPAASGSTTEVRKGVAR